MYYMHVLRECKAEDQEFMLMRSEVLIFICFDSVSMFINAASSGSDV
jgi:hypothetical protein